VGEEDVTRAIGEFSMSDQAGQTRVTRENLEVLLSPCVWVCVYVCRYAGLAASRCLVSVVVSLKQSSFAEKSECETRDLNFQFNFCFITIVRDV
jgi:hypothetical protein